MDTWMGRLMTIDFRHDVRFTAYSAQAFNLAWQAQGHYKMDQVIGADFGDVSRDTRFKKINSARFILTGACESKTTYFADGTAFKNTRYAKESAILGVHQRSLLAIYLDIE